MGRLGFRGAAARAVMAALGLCAATLAVPKAAFALSPACVSINNNEIGFTNNGQPTGLSGTYRIAADGSTWSSNGSNYNLSFSVGEVISWSYTTTQGAPYVHVLRYDSSSTFIRSGSVRNGTAASGSGTMTIGAGQETDYLNLATTDYPLDSFSNPGTSEPSRRNTATRVTISCSAPPPPAPTRNSFTFGSVVAYNASSVSINVAAGGSATQSPTGYSVASAPGGGFASSAASSGGGTVSISSAGVATYAPRVGYRGNDTFYAKATNAAGSSSAATITVAVGNPTLSVTLTGSGARKGTALSGYALAPTGGAAPYTCALSNGASLPSGVTLGANCALSGTPVTAGTFSFNVDVTDSSVTGANGGTPSAFTRTDAAIANLTIAQAAPTVTAVAPNSGSTTGGAAVTLTGSDFTGATGVSFGGATASFSVDSDSQITAAAPVHAAGVVNITVTGPGGASATAVANQFTYAAPSMSLSPAAGALAGASVGAPYSQTFTAGSGVAPYSYARTSGALPTGLTLAGGTLSGTPTTAGVFNFTLAATDSSSAGAGGPYAVSQSYSVNVAQGAQTITFSTNAPSATVGGPPYAVAATSTSGLTVAFSLDGSSTGCSSTGSTISFTATGTCVINATQAGDANWSAAPQAQQSFAVAAGALAMSPASATGLAVGGAYVQTNAASGGVGPYAFSLDAGALPPGTSLDTSTGRVSGAPTTAGAFSYRLRVTDSQGAPASVLGSLTAVTIAKGAQTIGFTSAAPSASAGGPDYIVSAAANSGLGVVLTLDGASTGCALSASTVSFTAAGTCVINADQAGDSNWNAATRVQQSFAVATSALAVNAGAASGTAVGASYSQANPASGGTRPYAFALASGALPPGTTLDAATGTVSGSPTTVGAYSYAIKATDSQTTPAVAQGATVSVTVAKGAQTIAFTSAPPAAQVNGASYSLSATATSGLIVAFSLDASSTGCAISGTTVSFNATGTCVIDADQAGNASWNAATRAQQSFAVSSGALAVSAGTPSGATVGAAYSQTNPASGGMAPYSYSLASGALPPGTALNAATGAISGTPSAAGVYSYVVKAVDSQGTPASALGATVSATIAKGAQTLAFLSAPPATAFSGSSYTLNATASSGLPVVYSLDAASSGCSLSGAVASFTAAGTCLIDADQAGDANWNPAARLQHGTAVSVSPAILVGPGSLPNAILGANYRQALSASGGVAGYVFTLSAGALPAGVTLRPDGVLSGAPSVSGTFSFTITATDASTGGGPYSGSQGYTLLVEATPLALPQAGLADATVGVAYSASFGAVGGVAPYSYGVTGGAVPPGLTLTANGQLSGAPTAIGTYQFTITVTDSAAGTAGPSSVPRSYTLKVGGAPPTLTGGDLAAGQAGVVYSQSIPVSGGVGPFTFALTAAALPPGLSLSSGGALTGTPSAEGDYAFTVSVTDGMGYTTSKGYRLLIGRPPPAPLVTAPAPAVVTTPAAGGPLTASVSLPATTSGVATSYEIGTAPAMGQATLTPPGSGANGWTLAYTPTPTFMGEATVAVVAVGPGGKSAPANFVFRVPGKAPDFNGQVAPGQALVFEPTTRLTGGPYSALRITRQPDAGSARVEGLTIVFTPNAQAAAVPAPSARKAPGAAASSMVEARAQATLASLDYVVVLPFGDSSPGRIDIDGVPGPILVPLSASTLAGRSVTVSLTDKATGGPFTAAQVVSVTDGAGSASVREATSAGARTYDLVFTPQGAFMGEAIVTYRLSNAGGSAQGALRITVTPRPDPSLDPEVRGLVSAELGAARRFAQSQTDNFHRRLEQVRRGGRGWDNGLRFNLSAADDTLDPQAELRRQLGLPDQGGDARPAMAARALDSVAGLANAPPTAGRGPQGRPSQTPALGVWTAGAIDWGRRDARGQRDYRFSTSGISGGVDVKLSEQLVVGVGAGYGLDRTSVGSNGSLSRGENYVGAVYGGWRGEGKLVIDGVLGFGSLDYNSRRWSADAGRMLTGERHGSVVFGSASFALEQTRRALSWSPYARVQFSSIDLDRFAERGSDVFALNYRALDTQSLSSALGASFDWSRRRRTGAVVANLRVEWRHEFEATGNQVVSYADWAASPDYAIGLERWARDSLSLVTGVEWQGVSGWNLGADYSGMIGPDLVSHGLRLKLMKDF